MESIAEPARKREKNRDLPTFVYWLRVAVGLVLIVLFLLAASRTTRDCTVGLYVYDICAWVWVREQLGLPASKFLRAAFLELIGLTLTLGIFLTIRFVFPFWASGARARQEAGRSNKL